MPWVNSPEAWRFKVKVNFYKGIPAGDQLVSKECAKFGVDNDKCKRIKRPEKVDDDNRSSDSS